MSFSLSLATLLIFFCSPWSTYAQNGVVKIVPFEKLAEMDVHHIGLLETMSVYKDLPSDCKSFVHTDSVKFGIVLVNQDNLSVIVRGQSGKKLDYQLSANWVDSTGKSIAKVRLWETNEALKPKLYFKGKTPEGNDFEITQDLGFIVYRLSEPTQQSASHLSVTLAFKGANAGESITLFLPFKR